MGEVQGGFHDPDNPLQQQHRNHGCERRVRHTAGPATANLSRLGTAGSDQVLCGLTSTTCRSYVQRISPGA